MSNFSRARIAGEWAAKFWLLPDAIRDRRSDKALIRVVVYGTSFLGDKPTSGS
jgi:hypothetical protein